jgi:hypothetical protein
MITSKIAANQTFAQVSRLHRPEAGDRAGDDAGDQIRTARGEKIDGVKADISPLGVNRWQHFNAEFNAVVRSIRIADQAMGEIESHLDQVTSDVAMYVKQYPPYPPDSEERAQLLNRFAGLRQLADRLAMPPDPRARQIIGPQGRGSDGEWQVHVAGKDLGISIRRQPVHTGEDGLNLPALPAAAGDREIAALGDVLAKAQVTMRSRRAALAEDAVQAIREAEKNV